MKKWFGVIIVASSVFLMATFSTRVESWHMLPFTYGAAAGYLNVDDGRQHPFKGTISVNKFGNNLDVDAAEESIWDADDLDAEGNGPARCFVNIGGTAANLYISSDHEDDASDNNNVTVTVEGLDANWDAKTVADAGLGVATASGTAGAQIGTGTWLRVNRAYVTSATSATGNIYIHLDSDGIGVDGIPDTIATDSVAVITAGENQTLQACYSVANNKVALMSQYCIGNVSTSGAVNFRLRKSVNNAASRTQEYQSLSANTSMCITHDPPVVFAEKTDIELTAIGSGATNKAVSGTFDLVVVPE